MTTVTDSLGVVLRDITIRQATNVANHTKRKVTEDDLTRWLPLAREIHRAQLAEAPHPADVHITGELHEYAARMIALNLVARERGFHVERVAWSSPAPPARAVPELEPRLEIFSDDDDAWPVGRE